MRTANKPRSPSQWAPEAIQGVAEVLREEIGRDPTLGGRVTQARFVSGESEARQCEDDYELIVRITIEPKQDRELDSA